MGPTRLFYGLQLGTSVQSLEKIVTTLRSTGSTEDIALPSEKAVRDALDLKANSSHEHAASDVTSGTLDGDLLPSLSTSKKGGVPATDPTPSGKVLSDFGTWVNNLNVNWQTKNCLDNAVTHINVGLLSETRSLHIWLILKSRTKYRDYKYNILSNDSVLNDDTDGEYFETEPFPGTVVLSPTIDVDNIRLTITLTGVGTAVTANYQVFKSPIII